jgi:phage shock protein E
VTLIAFYFPSLTPFSLTMSSIETLVRTAQATIIDVRTPQEYQGGHVAGSKNIPLNEIPKRVEELKQMKNIVLCCTSGGRSAQARQFLAQNGITALDGGSWTAFNCYC